MTRLNVFVLACGPLLAAPGAVAEVSTVASADGVKIRYEVSGASGPTVVLVHCWTCDRRLWDAQVPRLAASRLVVALDLAGHGESGRGRQAWTIGAFGDDVAAVVRALKSDRVVLVGHSMGGHAILEAALRLEGRVAGLVAVDSLLDFESRMPSAQVDAFLAPLQKDYPTAAEAFLRQFLFVPASPPTVVEAVVAKTRSADPAMAVAALRSTWDHDVAAAVDRLKVKIRAINSDRYPTNLEANRRHAPGFEVALVPGVGHYPMLEAPGLFGDLLEKAVDALASTP